MDNDIGQKSIGFLIDSLITCSLRCWNSQEDIMNPALSEQERLNAAIRAQEQNAIRSKLIKKIDEFFGQGDISMGGNKTYHTYFRK